MQLPQTSTSTSTSTPSVNHTQQPSIYYYLLNKRLLRNLLIEISILDLFGPLPLLTKLLSSLFIRTDPLGWKLIRLDRSAEQALGHMFSVWLARAAPKSFRLLALRDMRSADCILKKSAGQRTVCITDNIR